METSGQDYIPRNGSFDGLKSGLHSQTQQTSYGIGRQTVGDHAKGDGAHNNHRKQTTAFLCCTDISWAKQINLPTTTRCWATLPIDFSTRA
jgi:hypothetical protein